MVPAADMRRLEERVRELERLLGRKTMEVEILKEALDLTRCKKSEIAVELCCRGALPGEGRHRHARRCAIQCGRSQQRGSAPPSPSDEEAWPAAREHTGRRGPRNNDGKVVTLQINNSTYDGARQVEFRCWSDDVVHGAFAFDRHKRDIIGAVTTMQAFRRG